jgi:hypothetical protein
MAAQLQHQNQAQANVVEIDAAQKRKEELNAIANEAEAVGFDSGKSFLHLQRVAAMFASSSMVPTQYQGNVANCCIAINLARRLKADELMVMQNLYIVYGRPGWSSKFKIAMFNQTGRFTPVSYQFFGTKGKDDWGCRAACANRETGEQILGPEITIALSKAEGWYDKKSKDGKPASKWPTMPELMLRYRAASWMIDTTAPELTMGIGTVEEHLDVGELLDAAVEETQRRQDAKNAAFANSPSKDGVTFPSETKPENPAEPVQTAQTETSKQSSFPKKSQPAAPATQAGPAFSEQEPDPFAPGGDMFGK